MICDALQSLVASDAITPKQIADLLNLTPSSIYRHLSGEVEPRWGQVRTLFRHTLSRAVQERLLADLLDGTGWVAEPLSADMDVNGNGAVDTGDVIDGTITALDQLTAALREERASQKREHQGFRAIDPVSAGVQQEHIRLAIQSLLATSRAIAFLAARAPRSASAARPSRRLVPSP